VYAAGYLPAPVAGICHSPTVKRNGSGETAEPNSGGTLRGLVTFALWVVGLLAGFVVLEGLSGLGEQLAVQRGIDAHRLTVWATYTEVDRADDPADDQHVLVYDFAGEQARISLDYEPYANLGDQLCFEIDAEHPSHSRPCGTRGDLDFSLAILAISGATLTAVLLIAAVRTGWPGRRLGASVATYGMRRAIRPAHRGEDLVLRPATGTRWGMVISYAGSLFAFSAIIVLSEPIAWWWMGVPLMAAAALAWRCWQTALLCSAETVKLRGLILNRRIPADAVLGVLDGYPNSYPSIWWRAPSGRTRRTMLFGFWAGSRNTERARRHNGDALAMLRGWVKANRQDRDPVRARGTG
jgi:hypothetical protein